MPSVRRNGVSTCPLVAHRNLAKTAYKQPKVWIVYRNTLSAEVQDACLLLSV